MALGLASNKVLGLAMADDSLVAAEVRLTGGQRLLHRAAMFNFPDNVTLDFPQELGRELKRFLREHHFSARRTVVGIPAKWLVAKQANVPPVTGDELLNVLRMQVEREFRLDPRGLVIDCDASATKGHAPSKVLIAAAMRDKIEQLEAMTQAAKLKSIAITSTGMVLASAVGRIAEVGQAEALLQLTPAGVELTLGTNGRLQLVRHLAATKLPANNEVLPDDPQIAHLVGEAMRTMSLADDNPSHAIRIWNGVGLADDALAALTGQLGQAVEQLKPLETMNIRSPANQSHDDIGAQAAVLAVCGSQPEQLTVNFLEPKLRDKPAGFDRRKLVWLVAVGAAALIAVMVLLTDYLHKVQQVGAMRHQVDAQSDQVQQATQLIERIRFARQWFDGRPRHLDVLRQLTLAFPEDGGVFATSLAMNERMRLVLAGCSNDEQGVRDLLGKLQASSSFNNVKLQYMREGDRESNDVVFALDCTFITME